MNDLPIKTINLNIEDESGKQVESLAVIPDHDLKFTVNANVFLEHLYASSYQAVYMLITGPNESVLNQQAADITGMVGPIALEFEVTIPYKELANIDNLNIDFSLSNKHAGEMGVTASIFYGRFQTSLIPLEAANAK